MIKQITSVIGIIAGLLLVGCACLGNRIMFGKPLPMNQKLSDITNNIVIAEVVWPHAESWSYQLVVGVPTNQFTYSITNRPCPDFTGNVTVTGPNSILIEKFSISSPKVSGCNWLTRQHNLDGFILTFNLTNVLRSCTAGTQYKIKLDFDERPEEFRSLWLSYLQSQKQKEQESPNQ